MSTPYVDPLPSPPLPPVHKMTVQQLKDDVEDTTQSTTALKPSEKMRLLHVQNTRIEQPKIAAHI